ncbi:hypothetical protein BJ741DRAFT_380148 [Chytriomyces cf. hyalinus JEL632]|nr:hypothetical protein BJ741DRAFT_380148 [Chytriomyces cf. hyalinus JEL632]
MMHMVDNDFLAIPTHPRMPPATTTATAALSRAAAAAATAAHPSSPAPPPPPPPPTSSYPPSSIIHNHSTTKSLARPHTKAPKRYPCKFAGCEKDFSTSGHLSRHSRIHMGLKRFSCSVDGCDRIFVRADNRDQHDKSHRRRLSGCTSSDSCESDHAPPSSPEASLVSAHSVEVDSCPSPVSPCSSSMQFIHSLGHVSKASISFLID